MKRINVILWSLMGVCITAIFWTGFWLGKNEYRWSLIHQDRGRIGECNYRMDEQKYVFDNQMKKLGYFATVLKNYGCDDEGKVGYVAYTSIYSFEETYPGRFMLGIYWPRLLSMKWKGKHYKNESEVANEYGDFLVTKLPQKTKENEKEEK